MGMGMGQTEGEVSRGLLTLSASASAFRRSSIQVRYVYVAFRLSGSGSLVRALCGSDVSVFVVLINLFNLTDAQRYS